ncbi:hypothetical protein GRF63_09230 [Erythrobacter sp. GH3-10]|uniref:Uncharacterized protein n=1 Tax=Aurantiacibacter rhizosphaerae TaxID=2691582 RepID=A0A844XEA1_9SPHN|nr:hypothetical protein [Aurantiacibacter rhizosphaerae]
MPLIIAPCLALAACGSETTPAPTPTPSETVAGPRTLVAAGFADTKLGPRIVGPEGDEVAGELVREGQKIADIVSYVACPAPKKDEVAAEECVPADQPEGAVYTYVHRVTPVDLADELDTPLLFRTTKAAHGFANNIGFDRDQAEAVLGEGYSIRVQEDNGALLWRVEISNGWHSGEELTFFWQSTLPPEGPQKAYAVGTENGRAEGNGPFPAEEAPVDEDAAGADPAD